jgi:hypothetical protein
VCGCIRGSIEARKEKAENPEDLPPLKIWRTFIEDFRTFCLTAPDILGLSATLTFAKEITT